MYDLGPFIRRQIVLQFGLDTPILTTRIASAVLGHYDFRNSFPLSVQLTIYNKALIDRARIEGDLPATTRVTQRWAMESGAWGVGLGYPGSGLSHTESWAGHLVVIYDRRWLWDLSLDQGNRPERGIEFNAPALLPCSEGFLRGRERLTAWHQDCLLMYDAKPDDKSFREVHMWDEIGPRIRRAVSVRTVVENMEDERRNRERSLFDLIEYAGSLEDTADQSVRRRVSQAIRSRLDAAMRASTDDR